MSTQTHSHLSADLSYGLANDVAMSADGSLIYAAGSDGNLRVYNALTGQLEHTWQVGTNLGGIDISPDGSFLMATEQTPIATRWSDDWTTDQTDIVTYKVDLATGNVTSYPLTVTAEQYTFNDVAVASDGTVVLSQNGHPGWSVWVPAWTLDLSTGTYTATAESTYTQSDYLSPTKDGTHVLWGESNISDARIDMWQAGATDGFVATHNEYADGVEGFNSGVQAISGEAGLVAQYVPQNGLHIYDLSLHYQQNLATDFTQFATDSIGGLAFDSSGQNLYVLDTTADTISQISTSDWSLVQTMSLGFGIESADSQYADSLLVSPDSHYFTILSGGSALEFGNAASPYTFNGTSGDDQLTGTIFDDILNGGPGNDTLTGGGGNDTLTGGGGNDIFVDSGDGHDQDTITDFNIGDAIVFSDAVLEEFQFSFVGHTLNYDTVERNGGSMTVDGVVNGRWTASAAPGGGVELTESLGPVQHNDFTGDGLSDFLWRGDDGRVHEEVGQVGGGFAEGVNIAVSSNWHIVGTGDFDNDGRMDILWRNDAGTVTEWLAQQSGSFTSNLHLDVSTNWHVAGNSDFNGDGYADVLWQNDSGLVTEWLGGAGGNFVSHPLNLNPGTSWHVAGTADFNGDGYDDILWRNDDGRVREWHGTSTGSFAGSSLNTSVANSLHIAATGDFNGDGCGDILWRNDSGTVTEWLGSTSGTFANGPVNITVPASSHIVGTGDFDGDGHTDILWQNDSGTLREWIAQPNGAFISGPSVSASTDWHVQDPFVHDPFS